MSSDLIDLRRYPGAARTGAERPSGPNAVRAAAADTLLRQDRERIARDLHDNVLQRLFAAGLTAQRVAGALPDGGHAAQLQQLVRELDDAMSEIRATVFELGGPLGPERGSVTERLTSVVHHLVPLLTFDPVLRLAGPLDAVPEAVVSDALAVLREGLVNVARHAAARAVEVDVVASTDRLVVRLSDDGRGLGGSLRRSGLDNLRTRALRRDGSMTVGARADQAGGMCLLWSVALR